jgi:hypothetical protein
MYIYIYIHTYIGILEYTVRLSVLTDDGKGEFDQARPAHVAAQAYTGFLRSQDLHRHINLCLWFDSFFQTSNSTNPTSNI